MKYEIIEHEKLSRADLAAIIQFDSYTDAMAVAKAINESSYTNAPGIASEGNTGAFRVGKCVVFNAYNQACYDKFLKIIGSLESPAEPGESSVDTLARTLWDGMYDKDRTIEDDTDAAVDYICAMFPEAEAFREDADCYYFDYDGGKYFIKLEYSIDATGKIRYGKIVVRDYDNKMKPVTIDRDTVNVKGTLEKFFKKAKSAGDSQDSLASNLWESMADPDVNGCADTDAAIAYLESVLPEANISKAGSDSIQLEYKGMEYIVTLFYYHGAGVDGYLQFFNKQSGIADLEIDRCTENPGKQVRKLFDSPDSPASPGEPSLMERLDNLDAEINKINAEIKKIKEIINK